MSLQINAAKHKNLAVGILLIGLNLFWIYQTYDLWSQYQNLSYLIIVMIPEWVLFMKAILGLLGCLIACYLIGGKINLKTAISLDLALFILGSAIALVFGFF